MFNLLKDTFRGWREQTGSGAGVLHKLFTCTPAGAHRHCRSGRGREAAQTQTMAQVEDLLGAEGRDFVQGMIESASRPSTGLIATFIGAITLLFGALGVFGALQNSLNTIWEVKPRPAKGMLDGIKRFVFRRLLSFTILP